MKRVLALLFALLLLVPSAVFADVIVEPDNSFYRTHQKECRHQEGRTYLANGPDGKLDLYTAPNGTVSKTLDNGAAFFCQWIYTDKNGTVWGFSDRHEAWAPLGYTLIQYDSLAFEAEHRDEIVDRQGETMAELPTAYLYEYPGASNPIRLDNLDLTAEKSYTDEKGHRWGFVSYIYGIRNKWFCLDDPANGQLTGEKKADVPSGYDAPAELPSATAKGVITAVVCGVALLTLIVVLILFPRKKKVG